MAKTVVIGSKLPHGLILEHPKNPAHKVTLNGINSAVIIGATSATTDVDEDFWNAWVSANKDFPAFKNGSIFVAKSSNDAIAVAKEMAAVETGFEPMKTDGKDKRAAGVKKADKE